MANDNDISRRDFVDGLESLRNDFRNELDEFRRSLECTKGRATSTEHRAESEMPCNDLRREISELRQSTNSSRQRDAISRSVVVALLILATLAGWLYPNLFPSSEITEIKGQLADLNNDIKLFKVPVDASEVPSLNPSNSAAVYPTWREEKYTVLKPVYETVMKEERYTVRKPVEETTYKEETYTERRPVKETVMREEKTTVRRPVYETAQREERIKVRKPVYESAYRDRQTTIQEPVTNWVPVCQMINNEPVWANVPVTSTVPRTIVQREPVQTVRYVEALSVRNVPMQIVRYVDEERVRNVPTETVRYVEEEKVRKVPVTETRYVEEEKVRQVPVETVRYIEEKRVRLVPINADATPATTLKPQSTDVPGVVENRNDASGN